MAVTPVLEVDVPVMVVVEDAGAGDMSERAFTVSEGCRKEMLDARPQDESALREATSCERTGGYTEKVVAALKEANSTRARKNAALVFSKCMKISGGCAEEMAPGVVMSARFSGAAITSACRDRAQQLEASAASKADTACESNTSQAMVAQLQHQDLQGAALEAQRGLKRCNGIKAPCDFQLAPLLAMRVLMVVQQQQMQEVLLAGLRDAEEVQAKLLSSSGAQLLAAGPPSAAERTKARNNTSALSPSKPLSRKTPLKALSLLNIAERMRIITSASAAHRA